MNASSVNHECRGNDGTSDAKFAPHQNATLSKGMLDGADGGLDGRSEIAQVVRQGMQAQAFDSKPKAAFFKVERGLLVATLGTDLTACE